AIEDTFSPDSYWWLFRRLNDVVKGDVIRSIPGLYPARNQLVRERFDALEADLKAQLPAVIQKAQASGAVDPQVLDAFTAACVERVVTTIHELLHTFDAGA